MVSGHSGSVKQHSVSWETKCAKCSLIWWNVFGHGSWQHHLSLAFVFFSWQPLLDPFVCVWYTAYVILCEFMVVKSLRFPFEIRLSSGSTPYQWSGMPNSDSFPWQRGMGSLENANAPMNLALVPISFLTVPWDMKGYVPQTERTRARHCHRNE